MDWMLMPLRRYADFTGRSRRKEYWMFQHGICLLLLALVAVGTSGFSIEPPLNADTSAPALWNVAVVGVLVLMLAVFVPGLAVTVRRFHDQDKSGWMALLGLVPYVGGIVVLVFMCLEGTKGENRYGLDPKAGDLSHSHIP